MRIPLRLKTKLACVTIAAGLAVGAAWPSKAHHGWGFYNTDRPYLFIGKLVEVNYSNPHPEVTVQVEPATELDRSSLPIPPELTALGFESILAKARMAPAGRWTLDLAPIGRLQRWGMPRAPKVGDEIRAVGFPSCREDKVARPNLLVLDGVGVRQQSVALPKGCSGEPRG